MIDCERGNAMRCVMVIAFVMTLGLTFCSLAANGDFDVRSHCKASLGKYGIMLGYDQESKRITQIGYGAMDMTDSISSKINGYEDDFSALKGDDPLLKIFKAEWKAYAGGVAGIAETINVSVAGGSYQENVDGSRGKVKNQFMSHANVKLDGLRIVDNVICISKESCQAAIAVVLTQKELKPTELSITEYVDRLRSGYTYNARSGGLHARVFCDSSGAVWQVGAVPCWSGSKIGRVIAYEVASRADSVQVDVRTKMQMTGEAGYRVEKTIRLRPARNLPDMMSDDVEWFAYDDSDGNHYVVCAIRVSRRRSISEKTKTQQ